MISAARLRANAAPEQMAHLNALDRSHQRLNAMIDRVLLTQKVVAGKVESRQVDTKLEQIIAPATEAARAEATRKGVEFHTQYDPDLLVRVDPQLTRSAIQNLADNAAKYADVGHIDLAVEDRDSELIVHVRDTCEGLSEAELRTIFEPFERGTTGKSGTGLGLAIAKQAVEAQGGSIHAESPGQSGCHFWIELPKARSGLPAR
jgi:signal transduction histidine kinase